jgi:hypothetical protein
MATTPLDALKALSEAALSGDVGEALVVYDAVAVIGAALLHTTAGEEAKEMREMVSVAMEAAQLIRQADERQLAFRELLGGDGRA